jgi:alpha-amylase/alpha-mannosidase (GH57 family)
MSDDVRPDGARLKVVLAWHMHQPQYRDLVSGTYQLPWTYLHAIKDYVDMVAHLEAVPAARAVVNFAPLLLEQIDDYAREVTQFLHDGKAIHDPLLAALAQPVLPTEPEEQLHLIKACLRAHETRMIERFAAFRRLAVMARWLIEHPDGLGYVSEHYLADLIMWYHLAWLGETVRRSDVRVRRLVQKAGGFSLHDRTTLLSVIGELLGGVLGRYRRLAERGQVELSVTPYAHPMLPLLIDVASAREAVPDVLLPATTSYPGGLERAQWHVREGIATFERHFGFRPLGCWPSEGGVSEATVKLLADEGLRWAATGEAVLRHSLTPPHQQLAAVKEQWLYQPYRVAQTELRTFFRDDGLSDLIGFTYATWHADDAVSDLIVHLERIADGSRDRPESVVSIILDGENAWEHYPENGYYFLSALYRRLAEHPRLQMTTFADCVAAPAESLPTLVAGSWVYGTFSTWVGDPDKNRGWDMLADAKHAFDVAAARLAPAQREAASRQLAVCEGSDWFWWFGDYNPQTTVSDFERLYRQHLTNLYRLLGVDPAEYLSQVFAHGHGRPEHGGTMRKN